MWGQPLEENLQTVESDATVLSPPTVLIEKQCIEEEIIFSTEEVENTLEWYEHVALIFLLYENLPSAIENIKIINNLKEQKGDSSWRKILFSGGSSISIKSFSQKLIEALYLLKHKKLLTKWNIAITSVDHLDPLRVELFHIIDDLPHQEAVKLIEKIQVSKGLPQLDKTLSPELHLLCWIKDQVLTEANFKEVLLSSSKTNQLPPEPKPIPQPPKPQLISSFNVKHGLCVIINQMKFYIDNSLPLHIRKEARINLDFRYGSDIDRDKLSETFQMLSHEVEIYENLTRQQLITTLEKISKYDFTKYDDLVLCLLSHGEDNVILSSDSLPVSLDTIKSFFDGRNCKSLLDKPKIFIVQACQGHEFLKPVYLDKIETDGVERSYPLIANFFQAHATISGHESFRSTTRGAIFITELCKILQNHGHQLSLLQLTPNIIGGVAQFVSDGRKQISEVAHCLTRDVQFHRDQKKFIEAMLDKIEREKLEYAIKMTVFEMEKKCNPYILRQLLGSM